MIWQTKLTSESLRREHASSDQAMLLWAEARRSGECGCSRATVSHCVSIMLKPASTSRRSVDVAQLASEANVFAHSAVSSVTRDKSSCSSFGKLRNTMASSASPKRSQCEKETDRKLDDAGEAH